MEQYSNTILSYSKKNAKQQIKNHLEVIRIHHKKKNAVDICIHSVKLFFIQPSIITFPTCVPADEKPRILVCGTFESALAGFTPPHAPDENFLWYQ
ncbi:Hypothetical protein CINCED_3A023049 [Cinara cedri]|uniref:Uncharacterized protein n=1 Tax=Cinara cedri TaxID=506608 RepID=A0A5E4M4E2_9HEMI|nr:Hypothetical protein CINCED_3A023049 [Cinara cedri]